MRYWLLAAAVLLCSARLARADVAADWFEFADKVAADAEDNPDAELTPDQALAGSRAMLAMFESVRAIHPAYASYLHLPPADPHLNDVAAASAAAYAVLAAAYPQARPRIDAFEAKALRAVPAGPAREGGIALGERTAAAVLARPAIDPWAPQPPYRPLTTPGVWVPTALPRFPDFFVALKPWFLPRADAFRPPPPAPPSSASFARDVDEVRRLGGRHSTERSPAQTDAARFWASYDSNPAIRQVEQRPGRTLLDNCRLYALIAMGSDDASLALVEAKMHYLAWRPITAIRNGDRTGNPATVRDAAWQPLLRTPNHPEYPCGHCVAASFLATVLAAQPGGTAETSYSFGAGAPGARPRSVTLADYQQVVSDGRIWGGVHFRTTATISQAFGRRLARNALASFAPPLSPEPPHP